MHYYSFFYWVFPHTYLEHRSRFCARPSLPTVLTPSWWIIQLDIKREVLPISNKGPTTKTERTGRRANIPIWRPLIFRCTTKTRTWLMWGFKYGGGPPFLINGQWSHPLGSISGNILMEHSNRITNRITFYQRAFWGQFLQLNRRY